MKELTLEWSPMHIKNMEKPSHVIKNFEGMKEKSLERSPMNIRNVGKPPDVIRCYQSFQIHERNPTAQKPLECEECGIAYRYYGTFQRHGRTYWREPLGM